MYNPKVNRIIKVPPSMMSQSWMGSDFSNNDLSKSDSFFDDYIHSIVGSETHEGQKVYVIKSVPKPDAPVIWGMQLVVAFSILNTFLMAIFERTREFGVMMAIGTTPGRLTKVLLIESMTLTLMGIVTGIIIGCLITLYFQTYGIDISGASELLNQFGITGRIYPKLSWLSAVSGPLAVLVISFFAALYPALKVRLLQPVEAMRSA